MKKPIKVLGKKTRFGQPKPKPKVPPKLKVPPPTNEIHELQPPEMRRPEVPSALTDPGQPRLFTEFEWRQNPDRIWWLRNVLGHPYGQELKQIFTNGSPLKTLAAPDSVLAIAKLAEEIGKSEGTIVGMISGYERAERLLFERLVIPIGTKVSQARPGPKVVPPHSMSPPR